MVTNLQKQQQKSLSNSKKRSDKFSLDIKDVVIIKKNDSKQKQKPKPKEKK